MNGISRKIYLEPEAPTEEDNRSDQKRIEEELKVRGVDATMTWQAMKKLYPLCEKADWKITVSLAWDGKNWKVVDLEAGDRSGEHYGVAVDLGSTTVAVRLVDCNTGKILGEVSTFNGQIPYGTDILTRIFHCQEDPKTLEVLRKAAADSITACVSAAGKQLHRHDDRWEYDNDTFSSWNGCVLCISYAICGTCGSARISSGERSGIAGKRICLYLSGKVQLSWWRYHQWYGGYRNL